MKERKIVRCGHDTVAEAVLIGEGDLLLYLCQACYDRLEADIVAGLVYKILSHSAKDWLANHCEEKEIDG